MLLSLRTNGLDSLFKEVRAFKVRCCNVIVLGSAILLHMLPDPCIGDHQPYPEGPTIKKIQLPRGPCETS